MSSVSVSSMLTLALTRPAAKCPPDEGLTSPAETFLSDLRDRFTFRGTRAEKEQQGEDRGMAEVKVRQQT